MWPEPVERIASFLRDSQALGRIEELPPGVDTPPGDAAVAAAFECDGELLVALVPFSRSGPAIAGAKTVSPVMVTIAAITSEIRVRSLKMNTTTPDGGTELRCVFKWFPYQKVNAT